ncbi:MAG: DegT/DnrJ/EryC1/StrS family aminotransferase [Methanomicrobiales archaeon]
MELIPVAGPWITQKEIDYVADAAANAWYGNANMYHERFEKAFSHYIGTEYAMALPSCTSAIHLSLLSLGIRKNDEIIVPDLTWIATAAPVSYVGATPVFADCDEKTWCISVDAFQECITPKTKAVIPVDLYGNMPEMDAIREIAQDHDIAIIEDAAEAIGSEYHGKRSGCFGDTGVFSFHGSKTMTTGEGGMLVTDRKDLFERCLILRDHGRALGDKMFWNAEVGYKYKMSSMQAALGLAQLERIDELVNRKRQIFGWYQENLQTVDGITLNCEPSGTKNSYWMVTAIFDPKFGLLKEDVMCLLKDKGIDSRPFFYPLSSQPAYSGLDLACEARERNVMAYRVSPYGVNLPCGMTITSESVNYVCDAVKGVAFND